MVKGFMATIIAFVATIGLVGVLGTQVIAGPPPDTDGDKVSDDKDACPLIAGLPKNDGCPEGTETPSDAEKNHVEYWQAIYSGSICVKYDNLTEKTFVVPVAPEGMDYIAAIVKAGSRASLDGADPNEVDLTVKAGDSLTHSSGKNLSHVILCYKKKQTDSPKTLFMVKLVCVKNKYTLTVTNLGETTIKVDVNGSANTLQKLGNANSELIASLNVGSALTLKINDSIYETEAGIRYENFVLKTCQGQGNVQEIPQAPTIPTGGGAAVGDVTSLPVTSGAGDKAAALVVMIGSILATAGGYALRARSGELSI